MTYLAAVSPETPAPITATVCSVIMSKRHEVDSQRFFVCLHQEHVQNRDSIVVHYIPNTLALWNILWETQGLPAYSSALLLCHSVSSRVDNCALLVNQSICQLQAWSLLEHLERESIL